VFVLALQARVDGHRFLAEVHRRVGALLRVRLGFFLRRRFHFASGVVRSSVAVVVLVSQAPRICGFRGEQLTVVTDLALAGAHTPARTALLVGALGVIATRAPALVVFGTNERSVAIGVVATAARRLVGELTSEHVGPVRLHTAGGVGTVTVGVARLVAALEHTHERTRAIGVQGAAVRDLADLGSDVGAIIATSQRAKSEHEEAARGASAAEHGLGFLELEHANFLLSRGSEAAANGQGRGS
jgi:hypothetical protein